MQSSPILSLSPSFDSYSSTRLAEVAARVVEEFRAESTDPADHDGGDAAGYNYASNPFHTDYSCVSENRNNFRSEVIDAGNKGNDEYDDDDDDDFEFAVVGRDFISPPASADVLFCNGQIRPCFPLFNQELLLESMEFGKHDLNSSIQKSPDGVPPPPATAPRLSLRNLFLEDREPPLSSSCSSSEADDLDGISPESYCVWNPNKAAVEGRRKKSSSTGWSRRWRLRDLLYRSHSDGKDSFVFSNHPSHENASKKSEEKVKRIEKSSAVAPEALKASRKIAAPVAPYLKEESERRRISFLPYRQDLVGFFTNVNGSSRNLHRF